jgi:hypothetical protein
MLYFYSLMVGKEFCKKIVSGVMLIAFCAATIVFQNINLKNYYSVKAKQEASVDQSFNGQLGLLEEENQTTSNNTLEEEDDDFNTEFSFLASQSHGNLTLQFLVLQERLFNDHHPEIISPPPRG